MLSPSDLQRPHHTPVALVPLYTTLLCAHLRSSSFIPPLTPRLKQPCILLVIVLRLKSKMPGNMQKQGLRDSGIPMLYTHLGTKVECFDYQPVIAVGTCAPSLQVPREGP